MTAPRSSAMPPIDVVFFDAGGTLIRPRHPVGETYARLARNYGGRWDPQLAHQGFKEAFANLSPRPPHWPVPADGDDRPWWREVARRAARRAGMRDDFPFDLFYSELYDAYARPDLWMAFPEAEDVLERLANSGYRLAVLSNWDARLHPVLEGLHLARWFERVLVSAELGCEKPCREAYRQAARLFAAPPERCLMVGDDPHTDGTAPRAAGWNALVVRRPAENLAKVLDVLPLA